MFVLLVLFAGFVNAEQFSLKSTKFNYKKGEIIDFYGECTAGNSLRLEVKLDENAAVWW